VIPKCETPPARAELSVQERADHIAEWVRLTEEKTAGASCASSLKDGRKAGPQHQPSGINAAVRELGIDRTEAQRAVKIAGIAPEAKAAADEAGLNTQKARLEIAAKGEARHQPGAA
jgi:ParB family chromosome partitioning protein